MQLDPKGKQNEKHFEDGYSLFITDEDEGKSPSDRAKDEDIQKS